jgi:crotonobetainyl-CoA:carnitine CoA-transferase CaiB-like acyl-CoA transferase
MVSGPYCGKLLADMGADVIKVESPQGDPARTYASFTDPSPHPERNPLFLYLNTSKRGITLDLNQNSDLETFKRLVEWADILIDNHIPGFLENLGLPWDKLRELNKSLIYTVLTPYGLTGPKRDVKGDELTLIHAAALGNLLPARSVNIDRPPVKLGGFKAGYSSGIIAAVTSLAAVMDKEKTGRGRLIDISLHEVILNQVYPNILAYHYDKTTWHRVPDRPPGMGRMETADGHVILNAADDHHFKALQEIAGHPDWMAGDKWLDMGYRVHHLMDIAPQLEAWMRQQKTYDIYHKIAKKKIPIGPVATAKNIMEDPQYLAREYFVEVDHPKAGKHRYAGWPYKMSAAGPEVSRPAPLLGQHNEKVLSESSFLKKTGHTVTTPAQPEVPESVNAPPLKGIRILDFSWVWAGPVASMTLANLGAEVIRVESHKRTDLLRRRYRWPLPEPAPIPCPPNQGTSFNSVNLNKKSVTLDLSQPEGLALAHRLVAMSDVVLDNMRPGAMTKLGLGYEDLCQIKPDIIAAASSSHGLGGPETHYLGFATIHFAAGGGCFLSGYPDDHPTHGSSGDIDVLNAITTAYSILAALYHRNYSGEGQFIDFSQSEGVSSTHGEALLSYAMTGIIPQRAGNAHPQYAPHNLYKCWGVDRWLALEIHSDEEFASLTRVIGQPELAEDDRFKDMPSRKKNEAELDQIIEAWTSKRDRDWMVNEFCQAGLAAAPSRDARDVYADRHLRARNSIVTIEHPEMGNFEIVGPPWKMSDCDIPIRHSPLLGEHNNYVLGELLGLTKEEMERLREKDIII